MFTKNNVIRCDHCGRFIGLNTPFYGNFYWTWDYGREEVNENYDHYHVDCAKKNNVNVSNYTLYSDCMCENG